MCVAPRNDCFDQMYLSRRRVRRHFDHPVLIFDLVTGSDLLSAHGANLTIELDLSVLNEIFCPAAGITQTRKLHQIIQTDEFFVDLDCFHIISSYKFLSVRTSNARPYNIIDYSAANLMGTTKKVKLWPSTGRMIIGCKLPLSMILTSSVSAFFNASSR